jgi:hypothetical protein
MVKSDNFDLEFRRKHGTKENIKRYREHCLKNNCFHLLSFENFIREKGLTKWD